MLTRALESLKVDSSTLCVFDFAAPWGFTVDFKESFSWTVVDGCAWLVAPGQAPMRLDAGDSIIFPRGVESGVHLLLSEPQAASFPGHELWTRGQVEMFRPGLRMRGPQLVRWPGSGPVTRIISIAFAFQDRRLGPAVQALPERMLVRAGDVKSHFVQLLLEFPFGVQPGEEDGEPGYSVVATQMAQLLLIYLVRAYALHNAGQGRGWLGALSDPRMARVLAAIHEAPCERQNVDDLAALAGMSRTTFIERFTACVGQTPAKYIREWRMQLAREALASGQSVTELSISLGYRSESAFRAAFRKAAGLPPNAFRERAR